MLRKFVLAAAVLAACNGSDDSGSLGDGAVREDLTGGDATVAADAAVAVPGRVDAGPGPSDAGGAVPDAAIIPRMDAAITTDAALPDAGKDAAVSDAGGGGGTDAGGALSKFSFFVTSLAALRQVSGSPDGFGGDLSFGETGDGAGLRGADKICAAIAETSMPGSSSKQWRAFLSTSKVNAKDRVGNGPWYDRRGRIVAQNLTALLKDRPEGADPTIIDDLPNELGVPNHDPDGTGQVDNHDILTGTGADGTIFCPSDPAKCTCNDWTSSAKDNTKQPRVGHSWPRRGSGTNWMSSLNEAGCGAGINLSENGPGGPGPNPQNPVVGSGGGYGGFYCFALTP